jgi:hypothetical protein
MSDEPAAATSLDIEAAIIARLERRRARLEELSEIGMTAARDLKRLIVFDNRRRDEISPRFSELSRAIRLTLAMEGRLDEDILALCRGEQPPSWRARLAEAAATQAHRLPLFESMAFDPDVYNAYHDEARAFWEADEARRAEAIAAAREAARRDCEDQRDAAQASERECERERLVEFERPERFDLSSWNKAIEKICKDFGVEDASRFLLQPDDPDGPEGLEGPAEPAHLDPPPRSGGGGPRSGGGGGERRALQLRPPPLPPSGVPLPRFAALHGGGATR